MTVQPKLRTLSLLAAIALVANVVALGFTSRAMAFCSSCNTPAAVGYSAGYAAPVAYQAAYAPAPVAYQAAYAPAPVAYTTAYAPAYNTGWYPGRFLGRVNRSIWGVPTTTYYAPTYTAAYAPTATYTAAYAPTYTAAYAPSYTAAYAPACSSCSAAAVSYAPSYAPACSTCSACTRELRTGLQFVFDLRRLCGVEHALCQLCGRRGQPGCVHGGCQRAGIDLCDSVEHAGTDAGDFSRRQHSGDAGSREAGCG